MLPARGRRSGGGRSVLPPQLGVGRAENRPRRSAHRNRTVHEHHLRRPFANHRSAEWSIRSAAVGPSVLAGRRHGSEFARLVAGTSGAIVGLADAFVPL